MAARGISLNPLELVFNKLLARLLGLRLASEHGLLLLEPLFVVTLVGIAYAMVKLKNPIRNIREEVAVVGYYDKRTLERLQVFFKPLNRLRVKVVCRLVKEEHIRLGKKKAANSHAAALTSGEHLHALIGRRAVHRRHRTLNLGIDIPVVVRVNLILKPCHLRLGLRIIKTAAEILVALKLGFDGSNSLLNHFAHGLCVIQLRLLREIANFCSFGHLNGSHEICVQPGENLEKRRFARTIAADYADMRTVKEREIDIFEDGLRTRLLGDIDQTELIFSCHIKIPFELVLDEIL